MTASKVLDIGILGVLEVQIGRGEGGGLHKFLYGLQLLVCSASVVAGRENLLLLHVHLKLGCPIGLFFLLLLQLLMLLVRCHAVHIALGIVPQEAGIQKLLNVALEGLDPLR